MLSCNLRLRREKSRLCIYVSTKFCYQVFLDAAEEQGLYIQDMDGSLTGLANSSLVGQSDINPAACSPDSSGDLGRSHGLAGHQVRCCNVIIS